ncbi:MAG TPA: PadR family transcriptional regulator [Gemmatimonadales bacterium]|nr:PadR family transcriptional regulator [Gemmatimonadales bacterium]
MPPRLGDLEQLVLLALLRLGSEGYGVVVQREITARTGRTLSFATVYTTLNRLETKGLVSSRLGEATAERGGRRKTYFSVSRQGREAVREALRAIRTMTRGLGAAWEMP